MLLLPDLIVLVFQPQKYPAGQISLSQSNKGITLLEKTGKTTCAAIEASHDNSRKCLGGTLRVRETRRGEEAAHCAGISESFSQSPVQCWPWDWPGCGLTPRPAEELVGFPALDGETSGGVLGGAVGEHLRGSFSAPVISGL